jgi:hypothetical protein
LLGISLSRFAPLPASRAEMVAGQTGTNQVGSHPLADEKHRKHNFSVASGQKQSSMLRVALKT